MSLRELPASVCETYNTAEIDINHSPLKVYIYLGSSGASLTYMFVRGDRNS